MAIFNSYVSLPEGNGGDEPFYGFNMPNKLKPLSHFFRSMLFCLLFLRLRCQVLTTECEPETQLFFILGAFVLLSGHLGHDQKHTTWRIAPFSNSLVNGQQNPCLSQIA